MTQTPLETPTRRNCGALEEHRRLLNDDPAYVAARSNIENLARSFIMGERQARTGVTRIPVVVHVVWHTAAENISDAQIQSQIDVLNRDFRKTNPDAQNTPAVWQPLVADSRVEFFLATTDPNGAATTGVTRTQTQTASFTQQGNPMKSAATGGADPWPSDRYLNIWVCPLGGGLLGYAQFPGGPADTDGVVILHSGFGTTGTAAAPFNLGRTATHEIGHWLNLFHIWGDDGSGCNGSDEVSDTPNAAGPNFGTPAFPHVTCTNGPNGDMFVNYMDYTDDVAMFMFTEGQVTRMQATLDGPRASIGQTKTETVLPYSASLTHDLTGDGRADVVGFGEAGMYVALNKGDGAFKPLTLAIDNFGYTAGGWRVERHPRLLADLTGDGRADVVGFGEAGAYVALNKGDGTFHPLTLAIDNFGATAGGWRVERHPRLLGDLTGDGRADVVGFGEAGMYAALNKGDGTFLPLTLAIDNFGATAGGWRVERHPRFLADLTGDGRADVVGFGEAGMYVALNKGDGTFKPLTLAIDNFGANAGGWRVDRHPRFLADLTGDGRADVVGFGEAGMYVALNKGDGTFHPLTLAIDNFGYTAGGWRVEKHPRFLADLTGDGRADVVGFGEAGMYVALNKGDGTFKPLTLAIDNFGATAGGWRVDKHPRFLADLTGDGLSDTVGFGEAGMYEAINSGGAVFKPLQLAIDNFGYTAGGWRVDRHPRYVAGASSVGG